MYKLETLRSSREGELSPVRGDHLAFGNGVFPQNKIDVCSLSW